VSKAVAKKLSRSFGVSKAVAKNHPDPSASPVYVAFCNSDFSDFGAQAGA